MRFFIMGLFFAVVAPVYAESVSAQGYADEQISRADYSEEVRARVSEAAQNNANAKAAAQCSRGVRRIHPGGVSCTQEEWGTYYYKQRCWATATAECKCLFG